MEVFQRSHVVHSRQTSRGVLGIGHLLNGTESERTSVCVSRCVFILPRKPNFKTCSHVSGCAAQGERKPPPYGCHSWYPCAFAVFSSATGTSYHVLFCLSSSNTYKYNILENRWVHRAWSSIVRSLSASQFSTIACMAAAVAVDNDADDIVVIIIATRTQASHAYAMTLSV